MKPYGSGLLVLLPYLMQAALCQSNDTGSKTVKNIGVVLFPAFDVYDVFGSLEPLNLLSLQRQLNLYMIAATLDPVSTAPRAMNPFNSSFGQVIVPNHTFDSVVRDQSIDLNMLLVPGGLGTRSPDLDNTVQFVADVFPRLQYLLAPCTGAGIAARAGVLDGRRATTNKRSWDATVAYGPRTYWVARARWVQDGHVFTGSGVTAAVDTVFAWIGHVWGEAAAADLALGIEYERHTDPSWDPFGEHYGLSDVPPLK